MGKKMVKADGSIAGYVAIAAALLWSSNSIAQQADPLRSQPSSAAVDWSAKLANDVRQLHRHMLDDHPGAVDPLNPGFRANADAALALALERARQTNSRAGWWWALRGAVAAFDDGHVQLRSTGLDLSYRWPGFMTAYRGNAQHVVLRDSASASSPPIGARLIACDGIDADTLAARRIGAFRGLWQLPSQRAQLGWWQFVDADNPWIDNPARCDFIADGTPITVTLDWQPVAQAEIARLSETATALVRPEFGIRHRADGGYWIAMPDFDGEPGSATFTAMNALLSDLTSRIADVRQAPYVVLDVRGNGGGSSTWADRLSEVLWGQAWIAHHQAPSSTAVDWRASPGNVDLMRGYQVQLRDSGDAETLAYLDRAVAGMDAAIASGTPYWRDDQTPSETASASGGSNPVAGPVFLLTDSVCASACLDAADRWLAAGAVHIGSETSADSLYMEVRSMDLPSHMAQLGIPIKVYRGRARGHNQSLIPRHIYGGAVNDTPALERWVAALPRHR